MDKPLIEKKCSKCHEIKSIERFYKKSKLRKGKVQYFSECKDCRSIMSKQYRNNFKEDLTSRKKLWRLENKEKITDSNKKYRIDKKAFVRTRWRLKNFHVRGVTKSLIEQIIGMSVNDYEKYIDTLLNESGLIEDNWEIDHIIPLNSVKHLMKKNDDGFFDMKENIEILKNVFHYSNVQILSHEDNLKKRNST